MTTPERLKHRQVMLGWFVLVLAVGTALVSSYLTHDAQDQRSCLRESFSSLTDALDVRAELTAQQNSIRLKQSDVLSRQVRAQSNLILSVSTAGTRTDVQTAFDVYAHENERLAAAQDHLADELATLTKQQDDVDVPPFPEGKCD